MDRTVIRIQEFSIPQPQQLPQKVRCFHLEAWPPGINYPNAHQNQQILNAHPHTAPYTTYRQQPSGQNQNLVHAAGADLLRDLSRNNEVQHALGQVGNHTGSTWPVYLDLPDGDAEQLPWESLYNQHPVDFLATRTLSPIGRIGSSIQHLTVRHLDQKELDKPPELRVLAVLAAQGISSAPEWKALWNAKQHADGNGRFQIVFDVLVGDPTPPHQASLVSQIAAQLPAGQLAQPLKSKPHLLARIAAFKPHVIHVFCHGGQSTQGGPLLELATPGSATGISSVVQVDANEILNEVQQNHLLVWLALLNVCNSGSSGGSGGSQSLARSLVSQEIAAAIGMDEAISDVLATTFTRGFYRRLVDLIDACLAPTSALATAPPAGPYVLEWADVTTPPRRGILESMNNGVFNIAAAMDHKEWALPLLYTVPAEFRFEIRRATSGTQGAFQRAAKALADAWRYITGVPVDLSRAAEKLAQ